MSQDASKPTLWHVAVALGYTMLLLLVYPAVLIAVQDFPDFSGVGVKRYFDPLILSHFQFEEEVLALGFIATFLSLYSLLSAKQARVQFIILAMILSAIGYGLGVHLTADIYPLSPVIARGIVMTYSIFIAMIVSERFLFHVFNRNVFGYPAVRFRGKDFFCVLYMLIPIVAYPALLMLRDVFPNLAEFRLNRYFERSPIFYFSYQHVILTLAFVCAYIGTFTLFFVTNNKVKFFLAVSLLSFVLYDLATYVDSFSLYVLGMRINSCGSGDASVCLNFFEQGMLLALCTASGIAIVARVFKFRGHNTLYEASNSSS